LPVRWEEEEEEQEQEEEEEARREERRRRKHSQGRYEGENEPVCKPSPGGVDP
jgi:hypothetical protein